MSLNLPFSSSFLSGRPYDGHADEAAGLSRLTVHGAAPSPMRYSEARHGTPEAFARSRDGEQYVREVRHTLAGLRDFALTHARHLDAGLVCEALQQLEDKITRVEADGRSLLGSRAGCIYNAGKALLDDIGVAMRDERVPLTTRLGALRVLAENATPCVDGMLSQLNHCLSAVNGRHSPLLGLALALSADLLDEAIVQALRQHNAHADADYAASEIHHVNGLKEVVFPQLGRSFQPDRIARRPSQALVSTCMALIEQVHRPTTLAIAMADRIRARVEADASQQLGIPAEVLRSGFPLTDEARQKLQDITHAMRPEFGELPLDTLMDWNDAEEGSMLARLYRGNTLLALHVLTELHKLGMVDSRALQASSAILRPATQEHPAVTLKALDGALCWAEESGCRRPLTLSDLQPHLLSARGSPRPFMMVPDTPSSTQPAGTMALTLDQLLDTALHQSSPHELQSLPIACLHTHATTASVLRRLDDASLQASLRRSAPDLDDSQPSLLLQCLVRQGREALLQPDQLQQWCSMDLPTAASRLWFEVMPVATPSLLKTVGNLLLHIARDRGVQGGDTPNTRAWLAECMVPESEADRHPLMPLFMHPSPPVIQMAVDLISTAHETGLLPREQAVRALAIGPFIMKQTSLWPAGSIGLLPVLLDAAHPRMKLTGDEMLACIGEGAGNPMLAPSQRGSQLRADLLCDCLWEWVKESRITMDHWWRLMSPTDGEGPGPHAAPLAVRLSAVPASALRSYMNAVQAAAQEGWLTKPELLRLVRALPGRGAAGESEPGDSQPTLFRLLSAPSSWSGLNASSQRLIDYMAGLYRLSLQEHLTGDDLRLILREPDRPHPPLWNELRSLARSHPFRQSLNTFLQLFEFDGLLTKDERHQMLPVEPPGAPPATAHAPHPINAP